MTNASQQDLSGVIRITREETLDSRVDDLLNRQRSLLGEGGVTREQRRRWYYQNWFVFMLVGLVAGVLAWGLLEPGFDDFPYIQGPLVISAESAGLKTLGKLFAEDEEPDITTYSVNGQEIYVVPATGSIRNGKVERRLRPRDLENGKEVGVYVESDLLGDKDINVAVLIDLTPSPSALKKGKMSLESQQSRNLVISLLYFPVIAGLIGLAIGAADGVVCRLIRRAVLAGVVGLIVGFVGGAISGLLAEVVYAPLTELANRQSQGASGGIGSWGFSLQMMGRGLAWAMAGTTMGLGQGIALRSRRLALYGFLGGVIGGLLGGILFDPIDLMLLGGLKPSAHWSRLAGIAVIGMSVGAAIGVVELLSRDAWLRMTHGPLAGKEFVLFKDTMNIGASSRSDIYLFNDPLVADRHAVLRLIGDDAEIESLLYPQTPVYVNGRAARRTRLRSGDQIAIGQTYFIFERRSG